jgi:outer membrane protein assembly factor BamC
MYRSPLLIIVLALSLGGCSKVLKSLDHVRTDTKNKYEKAETMPDLEIPPGLSTEAIRDRMVIPEGGESAKFSTYQDRRAEVDIDIDSEEGGPSKASVGGSKLLENEHVLSLPFDIFEKWSVMELFVESEGYGLELNDADLGILETSWIEKSRIARNKFKIFAENDENLQGSLLYVSIENHELLPTSDGVSWQRVTRSIDEEKRFVLQLETRLLGSISLGEDNGQEIQASQLIDPTTSTNAESNVELVESKSESFRIENVDATGSSNLSAGSVSRDIASELVSVGSGKFYMAVSSNYELAWEVVGNILANEGLKLRHADKTAGLYLIEVPKARSSQSKKSLLKKAQFWKRDKVKEYQLSLTGVGQKTEVVILDSNGRWLTTRDAGNLLNRLHEAVNRGRI